MKYKILHLPTATYIYHHPEEPLDNTHFIATEYETLSRQQEIQGSKSDHPSDFGYTYSSIFNTRELAQHIIDLWGDDYGISMTYEKDDDCCSNTFKKEHLQIIEVEDEV